MNNDTLIRYILTAMKVTKTDVKDDFEAAISRDCHNGLAQSVWSRRASVLIDELKNFDAYEVLKIKRGFWEVDPVFNAVTGELYILTTKNNFENVKRKFEKMGTSTHYSYDLLMYNSELLPVTSEVSLFEPDGYEDAQRYSENQKMLGSHAENVNKVYIVVVDYIFDEAIEAKIMLLNDKYELVTERDLTNLLHTNDSVFELDQDSSVTEKSITPIVKLKNKKTRKSD